MRRGPSKRKGLVTTATVRAPSSLASEGHNGRGTCPCAASEPRRDKNHIGTFENFNNLFGVFKGRLTADGRVGTCSQAGSEFLAERYFVCDERGI